jgi:hypothetical protein
VLLSVSVTHTIMWFIWAVTLGSAVRLAQQTQTRQGGGRSWGVCQAAHACHTHT